MEETLEAISAYITFKRSIPNKNIVHENITFPNPVVFVFMSRAGNMNRIILSVG